MTSLILSAALLGLSASESVVEPCGGCCYSVEIAFPLAGNVHTSPVPVIGTYSTIPAGEGIVVEVYDANNVLVYQIGVQAANGQFALPGIPLAPGVYAFKAYITGTAASATESNVTVVP